MIDRISAYRLLSALSGLLLFCAGAFLLHRAGLEREVVLSYGAVWAIPYMAFTVAGISNYAPAIGLGSFLAACAIALVLSERRLEKAAAGVLLVAGSWLGIPIWPDFIFLAPVATLAVAFAGVFVASKDLRPSIRRTLLAVTAASLVGAAAFFANAALGTRTGNIGTRLPGAFPKSFDRNVLWMVVAVMAPVAAASASVLALRLIKIPEDRARRLRTGASALVALLLVAGFLLTPWTFIPYETERYWFSKLVREHVKVFLSNSLAWNQDMLSWKFYLGVAGWHDTPYPDWIYAAAKWALVLFLVWFPLRLVRPSELPPGKTRALVFIAGFGASLSVITLVIRYLGPGIPWGRFMLPWLPLVVAPVFIPLTQGRAARLARALLRIGILTQLWTAISVLGMRYLFAMS